MSIKHIITLLICIVFIRTIAFTQTATEAERYSMSDPVGTARNLGVGNSMFAIGPDISVIGSNPAGIAGFWKSEFTASGGMQFNNYNSYFSTVRESVNEGKYNLLSLPNIGFVLVSLPGNSNWKTSNWAIGLNRMADYRQEIQYAGNPVGSISDSWRENADGLTPEQLNGFEEALAYNSGAIYDFEEDRIYESDYLLSPNYPLYKNEFTSHTGGKSELFLGYGANYNNKIQFGATFNMPFINFTENRTYRESDLFEDAVPYFNELEFNRFINTSGWGINGKFGITVQPVENVHISVAAHTPTKLFLTDDYKNTLSYDYTDENNNGPILSKSPDGSFKYALSTPWSLAGGLGVIINNTGFLSASLKWTDYATMKYDYSVKGNGNDFDQIENDVNEEIRNIYTSSIELRFGGEMVFNSFRLRGGASLIQQPFANDNSMDPSYHAGIGYRHDTWYADIGYKLTKNDSGYLPYETSESVQPLVITDYSRHGITATVGFKF